DRFASSRRSGVGRLATFQRASRAMSPLANFHGVPVAGATSRLNLPAAAVRKGDDFEQMAIGVLEVHSAAAIVVVDSAGPLLPGVGPVLESSLAQTGEDSVEIVFRYQKGIVLRGNLAVGVVEVEGDAVGELDDEEWSESGWLGQAQDLGEERRRPALVAAPDN